MGGLLAFRVGNYDNTAEREQFRFLCERLKAHYAKLEDFCVFAGNYNIGCELDALFIKKDAIIAIEFKNYGGHVIASENGEWTCDGVVIKGGSRKTVLQQARINHSIVKKELKELGVESQNIKDVPTLIIFNQSIELENKLSATTKSWLHITDNDNFIAKLDDITCPKTDLSPLDIVNLAELLNLNSFYLEEFSNATSDKPAEPVDQNELSEDIIKIESQRTNLKTNNESSNESVNLPSDNVATGNRRTMDDTYIQGFRLQTKEELSALRNYAMQLVSTVWGRSNFIINVIDYKDFSIFFEKLESLIRQENIIILEGEYNEEDKNHLQKFLNKDIFNLSPTSFFWQTGEFINGNKYEQRSVEYQSNPIAENESKYSFILPEWIDDMIFNKLGAKYSPDHIRYEYNLNLNKEEILVYLGTYFPRSFSEIYVLFKDLLINSNYRNTIGSKKNVNILDLGCGTGGDIIGLLCFIDEYLPFVESVQILAIDGNQEALRVFEKILANYKKKSRLEIRETIGPVFIEEEGDLDLISTIVSDNFDFIISCKAICEMLAKGRLKNNAYKRTVILLLKKLSYEGILLIVDVTIKIPATKEFIPVILNKELNEFIRENPQFTTLAPFSCQVHGIKCDKGCFFKKEIILSHSRKKNDLSKIVYRFIAYKDFANKICARGINLNNDNCQIS